MPASYQTTFAHGHVMENHIINKNTKFPINLFCSLMLLSFVPFVYTLIRTNLIADNALTEGLGIAGHLEWFDLINETIQAFLIVPLYALLNKCLCDSRRLKQRIFQSFLVVNVVYFLFSVIILIHCDHLVSAMTDTHIGEVTKYLALETVGFIIGNTVCFVNVLFVVLGQPIYIYAMVVLKTIFTIAGDLLLIPWFGVNGAAYSDILVNAVCVGLCMVVVFRKKLMTVSFRLEGSFVKEYLFAGLFGGCQILLDNIVYMVIVCKMVNAVAEQGNYWIANNIIWGLLLIPIGALAEIIKKDCRDKITLPKIKTYHVVIMATFLVWLCFIPMLNPFLKNIMGIRDFAAIKHILVILIPFYLAYNYSVLFDSILTGYGKTQYCFAISVVVNLVYYPIVYGLVRKGVFTPDITFICVMFGSGIVTHLVCSVLCFLIYSSGKATGTHFWRFFK